MQSTVTKFRIPFFILLLTFCALSISAQTLIDVEVRSNVYDPQDVTINVGDTIRWTNVQGAHNVNGTQGTFPDNPESFGNNVAGPGWEFIHVFTTPGEYDYQCDPHVNFGMVGTVTVSGTSDVDDVSPESGVAIAKLYPLPIRDNVVLELTDELWSLSNEVAIVVYDLTGREMLRRVDITGQTVIIDTRAWPKSAYILQVLNVERIVETRKIVTQ